ncbi:ap2 domain transcription factor ap2xii-1, partial [Cystoisospora suis]
MEGELSRQTEATPLPDSRLRGDRTLLSDLKGERRMIHQGESKMSADTVQSFRRLHSTPRQLPDNALFLPEAPVEEDLLKDALLGAERDTCGATGCLTSSSSSSCVSSPRHSWTVPERRETCAFGRPPPQKPLPCSLADVQEAMESSTGVLRIAPPQRSVPVGDGGEEEEGDDAACTLPKGAEPLFWSRGRGLYFMRQLGTGLGDGEAGEAGYWVAASEEEYRGYVIHRKFSVAQFGFERAKLIALRWYNDRHQFRRPPIRFVEGDSPRGRTDADGIRKTAGDLPTSAHGGGLRIAGTVFSRALEKERVEGGGTVCSPAPAAFQKLKPKPPRPPPGDTTCRVPGVRYDCRDRAWLATWNDGVRQYKRCFSIKKYGFLRAKECAIRMRLSLYDQAATGLPTPNLRRYAVPVSSSHCDSESNSAAAPSSSTAASPSSQGAESCQALLLGGFKESSGVASSTGGEQGGTNRARGSGLFSAPSEQERGEQMDEAAAFSQQSLCGNDGDEPPSSYQNALAASVSALLRSGLGEEFLASCSSCLEEKATDDALPCREGRMQALRSLAEALLAKSSKGSRGEQAPNHPQAPVCYAKKESLQELLRQFFRQSFLRPGRSMSSNKADHSTCVRSSGESESSFSVSHSEDGSQKRCPKLFEAGEKSFVVRAGSASSDFEALLRDAPEMERQTAQAGFEERKMLSSFSDDREVLPTMKRLPDDGWHSSVFEKKRPKMTGEDEGNPEKTFSSVPLESGVRGEDFLRKRSMEKRGSFAVSGSAGNHSDTGAVWTERIGENGAEERVSTGRGAEGTATCSHFSTGRASGWIPGAGTAAGGHAWEDLGKVPRKFQEGHSSSFEKNRQGVAVSDGSGSWDKGGKRQQIHSFSGDVGTDDVVLRLTKEDWDLMNHLDNLDFEAADLDEVMALINQVPKVRGVCFDRKGLYWISQWHSQQKKNREWFGVKRLGFRKAWALAVCVRRDAEKVEDEPIDYPHIPEYEEVLGVTYARTAAAGRCWVAHYCCPPPVQGESASSTDSIQPLLGRVGRRQFPVCEMGFEGARQSAIALVKQHPLPAFFFYDPERRPSSALEVMSAAPRVASDIPRRRRQLYNVFTWLNGGSSWSSVRKWAAGKKMGLAEHEWNWCGFKEDAVYQPAGDSGISNARRKESQGEGECVVTHKDKDAGSPSLMPQSGFASTCDRSSDPLSLDLRVGFLPTGIRRFGGSSTSNEHLEITTTRDSMENNQESGSVSPAESEVGDGRCGEELLVEEELALLRGSLGLSARGTEEAETGDEETLSPLAIDAIVADAYESFSDEDSLLDAAAAGNAEKKRIKLPKIGGVYYKRDGNYKAWAASWHIQGKRTRRYFTVKKHGFKNAYLKAVQARRAAEKHEGISVKHRHHPVQWGAPETIIPAQQAGALDMRVRSAIDDRVQHTPSAGVSGAGTSFIQKEKILGGPADERTEDVCVVGSQTCGKKGCEGDSSGSLAGSLTCDKGYREGEKHGDEVGGKGANEKEVRLKGEEEGQEAENRPDAVLSTCEGCALLTPLERIARATELDIGELTERISRAAWTGSGAGSSFFKEQTKAQTEMNAGKQGKAEKKAEVFGLLVSENLELAMVRETVGVILSDLYRVVAMLSGAGRWVELVSPGTSALARPTSGCQDEHFSEDSMIT